MRCARTHATRGVTPLRRMRAPCGRVPTSSYRPWAPGETVAVAAACAQAPLHEGCFFLDVNSASPGAKLAAADRIQRDGGRYVEGGGDDVGAALPASRCRYSSAAHTRQRWRRCWNDRLLGPGREQQARRRQRHQDVPQRHDQGPRGAVHRDLHGRPAPRGRGPRDRLARAKPSRPSIGKKKAAYFFRRVIEHGRRRVRGNDRSRGDCSRSWPRAEDRDRQCRLPNLDGGSCPRWRVR